MKIARWLAPFLGLALWGCEVAAPGLDAAPGDPGTDAAVDEGVAAEVAPEPGPGDAGDGDAPVADDGFAIPEITVECTRDQDCMHLLPSSGPTDCLRAKCNPIGGKCVLSSAPDGTACDDGNLCTAGDACKAGECASAKNVCDCEADADCSKEEDGNPCNGTLRCAAHKCVVDPATVVVCLPGPETPACHAESCDPADGKCHAVPVADATPCDDKDACTTGDRCQQGACTPAGALACDDHNECTDDSCAAATGCVFAPREGACDDGNGCTKDDHCAGGKCAGTPTPACGCVTDAGCAPLEDGNKCNGTLVCAGGQCVVDPATVVTCDPSDVAPCHVAACIPATGACETVALPDGRPCDDGDWCTLSSSCLDGQCVATGALLGCDDGSVCTQDWCDAVDGCQHSPVTGGCEDGHPCTVGDYCQAGKCVSGPWGNCTMSQCSQNPACLEVCTGGIDEDGDGKTDCEDPDCFSPSCTEICDDLEDNDLDGAIDCADPDCVLAKNCRDPGCDDGTTPVCFQKPPTCLPGVEILAFQDGCYVCVNPKTCLPWGEPACKPDADCAVTDWCDPCGTHSCPGCEDCVPACAPHGCGTELSVQCKLARPECGEWGVAIVKDGCWACVHLDGCGPIAEDCANQIDDDGDGLTDCQDPDCKDVGLCRDTSCDDGSTPMCDLIPPVCADWEILAWQSECYRCVNPATCVPWGTAACATDAECPVDERCDPCASSSCPACPDCVAACAAHGCPTELEWSCDRIRPDCGAKAVAVVTGGCWQCVALGTCAPVTEDCGNDLDDDGDGATDCQDLDCRLDPVCIATHETDCADQVDNDLDLLTDCEDPDCTYDPACYCLGEGYGYVPGQTPYSCCPGLEPIPCSYLSGGQCVDCSPAGVVCAYCGDGTCQTGDGVLIENECNCPADCPHLEPVWKQPPYMTLDPTSGKYFYSGWHNLPVTADEFMVMPPFWSVHWWGAYELPDHMPYVPNTPPLTRPSSFRFTVHSPSTCFGPASLAAAGWPPAQYSCPGEALWKTQVASYKELWAGGYTAHPDDQGLAGASVFAYAADIPLAAWDTFPTGVFGPFWLSIEPVYDTAPPVNAPTWGWLTGGYPPTASPDACQVSIGVPWPWEPVPLGDCACSGVQMAFELWAAAT